MITIALISATGCSGKSCLSVAMAQLLNRVGRTVRLLQFDHSNNLSFLLNMNSPNERGLCQAIIEDLPLNKDMALEHTHGFEAYAFGPSTEAERLSAHRACIKEHKRIQKQLTDNTPPEQLQLLDLPAWPNGAYTPVMQITDLNLVLLTPDPLSVIAIESLLPTLQKSRGASYFLMNRFDPTKVLHLDIWSLCKTKLGHRLLPFYLHEDQAMPESIASGQPLFEYAPQSQLLEDQHKLSNWIDSEIQ
jgi:cellulose synthase operon protein YhjQ